MIGPLSIYKDNAAYYFGSNKCRMQQRILSKFEGFQNIVHTERDLAGTRFHIIARLFYSSHRVGMEGVFFLVMISILELRGTLLQNS